MPAPMTPRLFPGSPVIRAANARVEIPVLSSSAPLAAPTSTMRRIVHKITFASPPATHMPQTSPVNEACSVSALPRSAPAMATAVPMKPAWSWPKSCRLCPGLHVRIQRRHLRRHLREKRLPHDCHPLGATKSQSVYQRAQAPGRRPGKLGAIRFVSRVRLVISGEFDLP